MKIVLLLVSGLLFGVVFERYFLCMNSTITDVFLTGDTRRLRGLLAGLLAAALLFNILIGVGLIQVSARTIWLPVSLNVLSGGIFGMGMTLAGGCISGTLFKMGQGVVASFIAFLGMMLGMGAIGIGASFMPATGGQKMRLPVDATLPGSWGVSPLLFAVAVAGLAAAALLWKFSRRGKTIAAAAAAAGDARQKNAGPNFMVGWLLVALLNTIHLAFASQPLGLGGITGYGASGMVYLIDRRWTLANPLFGFFIRDPGCTIIGLLFIGGAFLSALLAGRFRLRLPVRRQVYSSLVGGFLMGASTPLMMGCSVTQVLGGVPLFRPGGLLAALGIVLGAWLGVRLITRIASVAGQNVNLPNR